MNRIHPAAEPAPVAQPGQDLRPGDPWPDIAARSFAAGRPEAPALRPADPDLVAARLATAAATPAAGVAREAVADAGLAALRVAGLAGVAAGLGAGPRAMAYDQVRYAGGWHYGPLAAADMPALLAVAAARDPAVHAGLQAIGGAEGANDGSSRFRAGWRDLAASGPLQRLVDLLLVARAIAEPETR